MRPLPHLKRPKAQGIAFVREVVAEIENPMMLHSVGKDSSVMPHLARKAFHPAPPPFSMLHVPSRAGLLMERTTATRVPREQQGPTGEHERPKARGALLALGKPSKASPPDLAWDRVSQRQLPLGTGLYRDDEAR